MLVFGDGYHHAGRAAAATSTAVPVRRQDMAHSPTIKGRVDPIDRPTSSEDAVVDTPADVVEELISPELALVDAHRIAIIEARADPLDRPTSKNAVVADSFEELVSPELALVDEDLGRRARARLAPPGAPVFGRRSAPWPEPQPVFPPATTAVPRQQPPVRAAATATEAAGTEAHEPLAVPAVSRRTRRLRVPIRLVALLVVIGSALAGLAGVLDATERPYLVPVDEPRVPPAQAVPAAGEDGRAATRAPAAEAATSVTTQQPESVSPTTSAAKAPEVPPPPRAAAPASKPARPPASSRIFVWAPVAAATHYRVEFYRDGRRVLLAFPTRPRVTLSTQWRYLGRTIRLRPGAYRWIVTPGFGRPSTGRYGRPIVASTWQAA